MIQKSLAAIDKVTVTMPGAKDCQMQLLAGPGDACANFAMRKFTVAPGGHTPLHQHDYEHEILILAGGGVAFGNGRESGIKAGDVIIVPANEPHQFKNTAGQPLEFICMVPAAVHRPGAVAPTLIDCAT
jgi:quercetin dioxygenase-like cupin family protein